MKAFKQKSQDYKRKYQSGRLSILRDGRYRFQSILFLSLSLTVFSAYTDIARAGKESVETANVSISQQEPQLEQEVRNVRGRRMAEAGQAAYTGEFFRVDGRKVQLLRSLEKVAVRYLPSEYLFVMNELQTLIEPQGEFIVESEVSEHWISVLQTSKCESSDELDESLQQLEQTFGVIQAVPVYIHEESGLELIATDEFIVRLAEGADLAQLQAINEAVGVITVRSLWGTTDQFILAIPDSTSEELLSICEIYWQEPAIKWAHPVFLGEAVKYDIRPNDPLYSDQWHLPKIQAPRAWETTRGSSQVVIAIIDDGLDIVHEDLKPNLWLNSLEIANNGRDDDNNGYKDDCNGWDFWAGDKDPRPADPDDNHGTSVAGVAAARGNNQLGVAGCAFNSRIMSLKVLKGIGSGALSYPGVVEALYYAAGRAKNGGSWRGANVINISLGFSETDSINDALAFAATQGHGGKGCPIFCAAGNDASGWKRYSVSFEPGDYSSVTFTWRYEKDSSERDADDTVWLDMVTFPDGRTESFEQGLPANWRTGSARWRSVQNGIAGNHAMHGNDGGLRAIRAGAISDGRSSWVQFTTGLSVPPEGGKLTFYAWPSSESEQRNPLTGKMTKQGDGLTLTITVGDHQYPFFWISGSPSVQTIIGYPASHPDTIAVGSSTNFDYRADHSRYDGTDLDFLAPGGDGVTDIWTTDRTGADGYARDFDYVAVKGTSVASPLAAGVAALMLSRNPDLTAQEVRDIMCNTCDKVGPIPYDSNGRNQHYGHGRINAKRAVNESIEPAPPSPTPLPLPPRPSPSPTPPGFIDISGYVKTLSRFGVYGVTVTLSTSNGRRSDITDSNGYYSFPVPNAWFPLDLNDFAASKEGYTFSAPSLSDEGTVDFIAYRILDNETSVISSSHVKSVIGSIPTAPCYDKNG